MLHLHRVAEIRENKMDSKNLSTVFGPNLVHSVTHARRLESIMGEMDENNIMIEQLITNAKEIFN